MGERHELARQSLTSGSRQPTLVQVRPRCNLDRCRAPLSALQPRRLCLEIGRRRLDVFEFLNENDRENLRQTLRRLVGNVDQLPRVRAAHGANS